jgi:hypothetical protein
MYMTELRLPGEWLWRPKALPRPVTAQPYPSQRRTNSSQFFSFAVKTTVLGREKLHSLLRTFIAAAGQLMETMNDRISTVCANSG